MIIHGCHATGINLGVLRQCTSSFLAHVIPCKFAFPAPAACPGSERPCTSNRRAGSGHRRAPNRPAAPLKSAIPHRPGARHTTSKFGLARLLHDPLERQLRPYLHHRYTETR